MNYFFVVGNKTSKSLSPLIFNHWFKKYNIKARYFYLEVLEKNFDKTIIEKISDKKTKGFNITTPFKKNILKHIDVSNIHAKKIGAVNCVTIGKKIKGLNTDWSGYLNSIKKEKINKNKKVLLLGYGGASQAIYYGFIINGFKNVSVFNRSKKLIRINGVNNYTKKYSSIDKYLKSADLIINTTPTKPLSKKQTKLVKKNTIVSDIVYKPKNTIFLKQFPENRKIYGISMLVEQAVPCFKQWFGFIPKVDEGLIKKLNSKIE